MLLLGSDAAAGSDEEICFKIIAHASLDGWQTGKTQVTIGDVITSQSYFTIICV